MKIDYTPCFILHRRNFSESSYILEIFSRDYGRINLIAKGAKNSKKHHGINFDIYQKYNVSWYSKSELGTLTGIDIVTTENQFIAEKAITGFYINEIILKLLHKEEPHPELFDMYELTLNKLFANENEKIILRYFEKRLLESLGYGVLLDCDIKTGSSIMPNNETLSDSVNINEAKKLLGTILRRYIDQPLESRKLYKSYSNIKI